MDHDRYRTYRYGKDSANLIIATAHEHTNYEVQLYLRSGSMKAETF